jgi:hypothetical protein
MCFAVLITGVGLGKTENGEEDGPALLALGGYLCAIAINVAIEFFPYN